MKKAFFLAALSLLVSSTATAQEKVSRLQSYNYIEVQGGVEWTATDAKIDKLLSPIGAVSIGRFFTPVVGARLHVSGLEAKGRFEQLDKNYKWNFITTDADLLINLSNLFSKNYNRPLNLMFVGGVGLTNAWKNDDIKALVQQNPNLAPLAWTSNNRLSHNLRAGLRLETNVTKPFGVSLEVAANSLDDRFNSKTNDADDWMISGMLGLSWRFGHKDQQPRKVVRQIEEMVWVDVPDTIIVKEKRPVEKDIDMKEQIFYVICKSDATEAGNTQLQRVAEAMNKYKDAKLLVVGYADKGTGNPKINAMYAERRAAECKDALVNKYGIEASRITTDSKGDTVQPFAENDKNRCVIITGEGTFKVTEYEEYEAQKITTKKVQKPVTREIIEEVYD
jgi:outer membrane protein OmpA-like peptidoglycan-associated protein